MGNSNNRPYSIGIKTDQQAYIGGSTISGVIYLAVTNDHNHTIPNKMRLELSLTGKEYAEVHYTTSSSNGNGGTTTHSHTDRKSHLFYQVQHNLAVFSLTPQGVRLFHGGQYEFLFSIQIPSTLPGSFLLNRGNDRCSVSYQLKAELIGAPSKTMFGICYPKARKAIGLISGSEIPVPKDREYILHNTYGSNCLPVTTGCIFNAGSMGMYIQIGDGTPSPLYTGESHEIKFAAENSSSQSVQRIKIKLEQKVRWKASSHSSQTSRVLFRKFVDPSPFTHLLKESKKIPGQTPINLRKAFAAGNMPWEYLATMQIPNDAFSLNGKLISVSYVLTVSLVTKGLSDDPCLIMPCHLASRNAVDATAIVVDEHEGGKKEYDCQAYALPSDWSAHTSDVATIPIAETRLL